MAQPDPAAIREHVEAAVRFPRLPPQHVVRRVLSPRIAVISSPDVDDICQRSRLNSFADLLLPFGDLVDGKGYFQLLTLMTRHRLVTAHDLNGVPLTLDGFRVRFAHLTQLEEPNARAVDWVTLQAAQHRGFDNNDKDSPKVRDARDITADYRSVPLEDLTPWYRDFRNLYLEYAGATEHESFGHPVACIIAVSALHREPIEMLSRLYDVERPSLFDKGFVDPNILKYYVLVHDSQLADYSKSLALFERMRKQLGVHCHLLQLGAGLKDELAPDIWAPYRSRQWLLESAPLSELKLPAGRPPADSIILPTDRIEIIREERAESTQSVSVLSPGAPPVGSGMGTSGAYHRGMRSIDSLEELQPAPLIAAADVDSVRMMIREFAVQSLIPYMERNIQNWNEQVASARRGVAGRLFSAGRRLFGHQAKTSSLGQISTQRAPGGSDPPLPDQISAYTFTSPEMQLRRQADYSFMLGDYRAAFSVYETLKRDFSTEKAWKHAACAQEMMGLCELMHSGDARYDVEYSLEQVVNMYVQRAKNGECATRAVVLHYELFRYISMYNEAADALLKTTDEASNLRCALFLEQAGHSFARTTPPKVRKYAFSLVLAGHRYSKEELRARAFHCYELAAAVFNGKDWKNVENHVHFALGRQAFHQAQLITALEHFIKLFGESEQSAAVQTSYLREFLYICQNYESRYGKDPLLESSLTLPVPVIDDQLVTVTLPNCQAQQQEVDDEAWQEMEEVFVSSLDPTISPSEHRRPTCAVGESVMVNFEVYNPLRVTIKLSDIVLECVHDAASSTADQTAALRDAHTARAHEQRSDDPKSMSSMLSFEHFQLENIWTCVLQPKERRMVALKLVPRVEGAIRIVGVRYTLDDAVSGYKKFWKRGRRLNSTKAERTQQLYAPDSSLDLLVTPPMPLLDVSVRNFPSNLLSGEVTRAVLEITNGGERDLRNLRVAISHPSMLFIGTAALAQADAYRPRLPNAETEWQTLDNSLSEPTCLEIPFTSSDIAGESGPTSLHLPVLHPRASIVLPLWIRADRIGRHTLRLLFHYQSEASKFESRTRTSRYTLETQVLPSLRVNAFTRPSTQSLQEYILGIEAESLQANAEMRISQISLTSAKWRIEPISATGHDGASLTLGPRQTMYAYYRIRALSSSQADEIQSPERYIRDCLDSVEKSGEEAVVGRTPPPITVGTSHISFGIDRHQFATEPLSTFYRCSKLQWRRSTLNTAMGSMFERITDAFTLLTSNDIDLAVFWQVPKQGRHGHHHVLGVSLNYSGKDGDSLQTSSLSRRSSVVSKRRSMSMLSVRTSSLAKRYSMMSVAGRMTLAADDPIRVIVHSASEIVHNFTSDGLCLVTMSISFKNCTIDQLEYTLELEEADEAFAQRPESGQVTIDELNAPIAKSDASAARFDWIGITLLEGTLQENEERILEVQACFAQPGVYNMNRWRMTVAVANASLSGLYGSDPSSIGAHAASTDRATFTETPTLPHFVTITRSSS